MKPENRKPVLGVGINDADYAVETSVIVEGKRVRSICPYYLRWANMLRRSYGGGRPTYIDCLVCDEWLTFSNFRKWMEKQDWEGNHLDKDILFKGNKIYSPSTCVFVPPQVNTFMNDHGAKRGKHPIGVDFDKKAGFFRARVGNPFTKSTMHLGYFETEEAANLAWRNAKHEVACKLSEICVDFRVAESLRSMYK